MFQSNKKVNRFYSPGKNKIKNAYFCGYILLALKGFHGHVSNLNPQTVRFLLA